MASVVGEREIDLSKLSLEQLNQLKTQLAEVRTDVFCVCARVYAAAAIPPYASLACLRTPMPAPCLHPRPAITTQELEDVTRHFATLRDANARLNTCRNTVTDLAGQSDGAYELACLTYASGEDQTMLSGMLDL